MSTSWNKNKNTWLLTTGYCSMLHLSQMIFYTKTNAYPYLKWQWIYSFSCRLFSFLYHRQDFYRTCLYIRLIRRLSSKKYEMLTPREYVGLSPGFWWSSCCVLFLCFVSFCVLCIQCCQCLWIVHTWFTIWVSLTFIYTNKSLEFSELTSDSHYPLIRFDIPS